MKPSDPDRDRLIAELLASAIELDGDQRREFLRGRCDDPEIVAHVEALLDGEDAAEQTLDTPLLTGVSVDLENLARQEQDKEPIRRTIGHYTLEEVLGEGGMGRVYLASQKQPVRRQVALKIMRHGLTSSSDQARFDAERQSLARLNHPNIAQMFEAGATSDGKLFFAMELVRGAPITRYCDRKGLTVWQRLQIFMDVLLAVQHAHQNQLLHRDLKPSNLLVTEIDGIPMVKIIDFGISLGLDDVAGRVRQGTQRAGTPGYSSPESLASAEEQVHLDTRADIYTLGIVLYELLCGRRPFDGPGDAPQEVWRRIKEDTPKTPHAQILGMSPEQAKEIAAARGTRPRALARMLDGALGAIVMKAIARDREQRYDSIVEFYDDLGNCLEHKPVSAHDQDFTYLAGLFMRRNYGPVLAAALLLLAMAGGMVAWSNEARRANLEASRASLQARQAQRALEESRDISRFLFRLFERTGEESAQAERMTTEELLQLGAAYVEPMVRTDPLGAARLKLLLSEIYTKLFSLDDAERMARESLALREAELPAGHPDLADNLGQLGDIYRIQMRFGEAEENILRALEIAEAADPPDPAITARTWNRLGNLYWAWERRDEAAQAFESALEIREVQLEGLDRYALAESQSNLGVILLRRGRFAEAEVYLAQAAPLYLELLGNNDEITARAFRNLAMSEEHIGQLAESEAHFRQAIRMYRNAKGESFSETLATMEQLARALGHWGRTEASVTAGRLALAARQRAHGVDHPATIPAMIALGVNLANADELAESERVLETALDVGLQRLGPDHRLTLAVRDVIGWLAWKTGDYETALATHEALLERRLGEFGPDHALTAFAQHNTALAAAALGRLEAADVLMADALATREAVRGPDHRTTAHSLHYLGLIRWNLGQAESAEELLERALATRRRLFYEQHPDVRRSAEALAALRAAGPPFPVTAEH